MSNKATQAVVPNYTNSIAREQRRVGMSYVRTFIALTS